jgi:malate dehydrogenase (oxaloacetate-decarboxylating)
MVAVVSDGSAVLGLGDIGASASLPVMEGKAVLFKEFGGVDAFPICVETKDPDEIVNLVTMIEPVFGGINLEDISAPRCFEIENKLKERLSIPVFHDDQHGTAIIVLAGLMNALRLTGKKMEDLKIVINGAGAAGVAIAKIILNVGVGEMLMVDRSGIIYKGREEGMNWAKEEISEITNKELKKGSLADAMKEADVFIGVSQANIISEEMVKSMNKDPIIFAMANPVPEIDPELAKKAGARVVGTGRSDYPNQINNVLAFPGVFRGTLDVRASDINEEMKVAAANALAGLISDEELREDYIIPMPFDRRVSTAVADAVAKAARDTGVARI